jgi:hypothetical protein
MQCHLAGRITSLLRSGSMLIAVDMNAMAAKPGIALIVQAAANYCL